MASEDYATEGQIKRLYAVLHSVGLDPKQWKKDQNIASYAKLTRAQCSAYIDEVEALEAEQKSTGSYHPSQLPKTPDDGVIRNLHETVFSGRPEAEAQRIREEQGLATAQPAAPTTTAELITKYLEILAQVTEAVNAEERIPDREKGYAVKFIYYSVKGAIENGGDHHEEQA